jgi:hypothetical protein
MAEGTFENRESSCKGYPSRRILVDDGQNISAGEPLALEKAKGQSKWPRNMRI